jgi:hypothetical protein
LGALGLGNGILRMDDVYLEGATPDGPAVVGLLSVIVDAAGLTVLGPSPASRRTVGWDRLAQMELGPPATLPDGLRGSSLQFLVDGRPLRVLVPSTADAPPDVAASSGRAAEPVSVAVAEATDTAERPTAPEEVAAPAPHKVAPAPTEIAPTGPPVAPTPIETATAPPPIEAVPIEAVPIASVSDTRSLADALHVSDQTESRSLGDALGDAEVATYDDEPAPSYAPVHHTTDEGWPVPQPVQPARTGRRRRHRRASLKALRMRRVVLVTLLLGLLPIAGGVWYFHYHTVLPRSPGSSVSDAAIAIRVGIQPGDLAGWKATAVQLGNPFAAGATTAGPAAATTAANASTVLAQCLHVPVSALDGAFGMGVAAEQRTAEVASPAYADPAGNGGAASSVVDVVRSNQAEQADAAVFADPRLFATCDQPFVQAMLPYTVDPAAPTGFATATVQPAIVPVTDADGVEIAAFQIARIANVKHQTVTQVTTAVAVFGGRVLATVDTVSDFVFPLQAQNTVVRAVEARVLGVDQL